jgi:hypothetical protein
MLDQVRRPYDAGLTATSIPQKLGLSRKRVDKWIRLETLRERHAMAPTPVSPAYYQSYLARRWTEGCMVARRRFAEIQGLGFPGCYTDLARFITSWRRAADTQKQRTPDPVALLAHDPTMGRQMTPQIASALCIKPRTQLTPPQAIVVDTMKETSPDFAVMRRLAMRFRGILRGRDVAKLDVWLTDAHRSGVYGMQRFARTLQSDLDAVRNGITEPWSNGQTEGQISRLKTLMRAMYGRAGIDLLRARMLPLEAAEEHRE